MLLLSRQEQVEAFGKCVCDMKLNDRCEAYLIQSEAEKNANQIIKWIKAIARGEIKGYQGTNNTEIALQIVIGLQEKFSKQESMAA